MQETEVLPIQSSRYTKLTVCPCCGCKFEGDLRAGCKGCGAQAVGEPLAQPEHLLPFYGRALFVTTVGAMMLLIFMGSTLAALLERAHLTFDFWSIVAAAETAAWRLKWLALPVAPLALWSGLRVCATLRREPARFIGSHFAHSGLAASALVVLMFATCIGVTIPERMRQHQRSLDAAQEARLATFHRAALEYRLHYKTLPTDINELKDKLPDPDGSIAAALADLDPASEYHPETLVASLPPKKSRSLRGAAIRNVSASTDDSPGEGVMFTDYELRLPGEDKILGTEDDWVLRNGVVTKPSTTSAQAKKSAGSSNDSHAP
jgi:hypothetical protein